MGVFYDYLKTKYGDKVKLSYTDTDSFILHIEIKDFNEDTNKDVEEWFDTSNYKINSPLLIRPLLTDKDKKVLGEFKDELGGRIMTKSVGLRSKTYAYLIDDFEEEKRNKGVKKCVAKMSLSLVITKIVYLITMSY